ncbi:MAG: hypothetical protein J6C05_01120 [Prevotella sp.]|nr:hypothetical protein [Prevotella sp.]
MNKNKTQILINRYLEGVTTPEEEKQLARELLHDNIPDDWKVVQVMLGELAMGEAEYDADVAAETFGKKPAVLSTAAKWLMAASVALLIGFAYFCHIGHDNEDVVAEAKNEKTTEHKTVSNVYHNIAKKFGDNQQTNETSKKVKTTIDRKSNNKLLSVTNINENADVSQTEPVQDITKVTPVNAEPIDNKLHYASNAAKDSLDEYQAPGRMEEFVIKMANYYHVKGESLACSSDKKDSMVVCTAYVFEDTNDIDIFRRLLQAACWYDDKTPGYLLNYSRKQFFFCLKDMRIGLKYLWIAERVRNKILLYCTHSPIDTEVSSDCFREYRDKLSNTIIY